MIRSDRVIIWGSCVVRHLKCSQQPDISEHIACIGLSPPLGLETNLSFGQFFKPLNSGVLHETTILFEPTCARCIVCSYASLSVCLGLWNLRCAPLQWYRAMLCTTDLLCAPCCTRGPNLSGNTCQYTFRLIESIHCAPPQWYRFCLE